MTIVAKTHEPQNQSQVDDFEQLGPVTLGPWTSHIWRSDPRHMCFLFSRYKFVAKMLAGKDKVIEVGCGDSVGTPIVLQTTSTVHCVDIEPLVLDEAKARYKKEGNDRVSFALHDVTKSPIPGEFDAAFSMDVIEHIPTTNENTFIDNICSALNPNAVLILGTPNITSDAYASPGSKAGHINLKSADTLRDLIARRFHNVFNFSMNDEVVHTGFSPMAHYLLAVGVGLKD
ncbi:MAG: class I SAM-dependent methyltransferase [Rhodospirillaceae bacterium]